MNPCYMNIININSKTNRTWTATQTKIKKKNIAETARTISAQSGPSHLRKTWCIILKEQYQ